MALQTAVPFISKKVTVSYTWIRNYAVEVHCNFLINIRIYFEYLIELFNPTKPMIENFREYKIDIYELL